MTQTLIRYLRLHCAFPGAALEHRRDGIVAVAAIQEHASLARLLLADMGQWDRNSGLSVTNGCEVFMREAHKRLVAGFGIELQDTLVVEWDASGHFDLHWDAGDGAGYRHSALFAATGALKPRSKAAFLAWAGPVGPLMVDKAESVGAGTWAGAEG